MKQIILTIQAIMLLMLSVSSEAKSMISNCDVKKGLNLIYQPSPSLDQIKQILMVCDQEIPNDANVLLLHGLLARKEGLPAQQYQTATTWLQKAKATAPDNLEIILELALTYEWAGDFNQAKKNYQEVLAKNSSSRAALLGIARIDQAQNHLKDAARIYNRLLKVNPLDGDAQTGLQEINAVIDDNPDIIKMGPYCQANTGLRLLGNPIPPLGLVRKILEKCDQQLPNNAQVLLLHGLLARKEGTATQQYQAAIDWLQKAISQAPTNLIPKLELAVTYEWASEPAKAKAIYDAILAKNPTLRPALLGKARVAIAQGDLTYATRSYLSFLERNPQDVEALNGMGRINLVNNQPLVAQTYFQKALSIQPYNADALIGLQQVKNIISPSATPTRLISTDMSNLCQANEGLRLMGTPHPPLEQIEKILAKCDQLLPNNVQVLLLHGILARQQGIAKQHYQKAIEWLKKAIQKAPLNDLSPDLELAVTYEWAKQFNQAKAIYTAILKKQPRSRPALLGLARIGTAQNHFSYAKHIYLDFLKINSNDIEAINGLARMELANKEYQLAKLNFEKVLKLHPNNPDALIGLKQVKDILNGKNRAESACQANEGLALLSKKPTPFKKINHILDKCDREAPQDVQTLLLHGLLARKQGMATSQYQVAINWLQKAAAAATPDNVNPALELAVTYEWANEPDKAQMIYNSILAKDPLSRPALLGKARTYQAKYELTKSCRIYQTLLTKNPHDMEALTGMGWVNLANKDFALAKRYFEKALAINPRANDAEIGLDFLKDVTRYSISINEGRYLVSGTSSFTTRFNFYYDLNALDQFILQLGHNSNEIQLSLVLDPTILPKNSVLLGFQRQTPRRYGWGINYEYRERTKFRVEHRLEANVNYYLLNNLQWFGGARQGFPSPWNNKLFYSGLGLFTSLPANFTLTGYWGRQQFGGSTSAYAFDISKEFSNRGFYDVGTAYSPSQKNWELHGRFILPITKHQAIEGLYGHYFVINTTEYSLGWRIYF